MPIASTVTSNGNKYSKIDDDKFEYETNGRMMTTTANAITNGADLFDETNAPTFEVASSSETAEQMVQNGELDPDKTSVKVSDTQPKSIEDLRSMSESERESFVEKIIEDHPNYGLENNGKLANAMANEICSTPEVMDDDDFEAYIQETGATRIARGVTDQYDAGGESEELLNTADEIAFEFGTSQNATMGGGNYGSGWHFWSGDYAENANGFANSAEDEGAVIECAIKPNAKFIDYDELRAITSDSTKIKAYDGDANAWALAHGYDGVKGGETGVVNIINRGALVMKKTYKKFKAGRPNGTGKLAKDSKMDANDTGNNFSAHKPIIGSVGVLVVKDGCILSGIRKSGYAPGLVCGPGGHVEDDETHEQAAIRETQEEFGITPKGLIQLGYGPWEPDTGLKPAVFLTTEYEGTLRSTDGEMGDLRFRSLAELQEMDKAMFQPFADAIDIMLRIIGPDRFDGGPGSGNWGHKGVKGQRGGSAPKGGSKSNNSKAQTSKSASIDKKYFPDVDASQGLNKYKKEYLHDKGFDDESISKLSGFVSSHVQYGARSNDDEMTLFVAENEDLIKASAQYEFEAIAERQKAKNEYRERFGEETTEVTGDMTVYRKGGNDDTFLSWTTDSDGVTLYKGTAQEECLGWDQKSTVSELIDQGIYPVAGIGELQNFYGENEVTFVNTNGVKEKAEKIKETREKKTAEEASQKARSEKKAKLFAEEVGKITPSGGNEEKVKKLKEIASTSTIGKAMDYAYENGLLDDAVNAMSAVNKRLESDSRSDSIMSASDLATAFNSAISKNGDNEKKYLDRYLKNNIIKVKTQNTSAEAFQALEPEDITFIAEEFGVDVSDATDGELQAVITLLRMDGGPGSGNHGHKGVEGQRGGSAPKGSSSSRIPKDQYLSEGTLSDLDEAKKTGKIQMRMNSRDQKKHYKGSEKYNNAVKKGYYVSTFSVPENELDALIQEKTGSGKVYINKSNGHIKETVDCGKKNRLLCYDKRQGVCDKQDDDTSFQKRIPCRSG